MLEYEYASSDVNVVMMMFFELFLLRKISEFPSGTRTHSEISLSKNSSKNIIITTSLILSKEVNNDNTSINY